MALFSKKVCYAVAAMYELAKNYHKGILQLREIAEMHNIPKKFLVHVLLQLKQHDLVNSTRGAHGGYQLKKSPQEITIFDIISALTSFTVVESREKCPVLNNFWDGIEEEIIKSFSKTTLADLTLNYEKLQDMISFHI